MAQYFMATPHTESTYNEKRIFTGRKDSKLSERGHKDAERLASLLKDEKIDVIYTSSLTRTKQTAEYIIKYHPGVEELEDDRILERDYGDLSGKSKDKFFRDNPKLGKLYHRSYDNPPPGGESIKVVEERVLSFLEDVLERIRKEKITVLVVCHANSIRPMIRYFEKLSVEEMMRLEGMRNRVFKYEVS